MPPLKVLTLLTAIAVLLSEIAPALLTPPLTAPTSSIAIAFALAAIVPPARLATPPAKAVTPETKMPKLLAAIVPPAPLTMPPANDDVATTSMPVLPEMLPLLVMPPANAVTAEISTVLAMAERMPALLMPPPSVAVLMTAIAVPLLASILLWPSTRMPPEMTPVSTMPPLRKVLLLRQESLVRHD
jgi:hypothetical protein